MLSRPCLLWLLEARARIGGTLKRRDNLCDRAVLRLGVGVSANVVLETRLRLHADAVLEDSVGLNAYSN